MVKEINQFFRLLAICWSEDKVSTYSASLAYYTIFALTPLIIICTKIIALAFGSELAEQEILTRITELIGIDAANQIQTMIKQANVSISGRTAQLSFLILVIASSGFFSQIQLGLNEIWGIEGRKHKTVIRFLKDRLLSFILVIIIAILLLISLLITVVLAVVRQYLTLLLPLELTSWALDHLISFLGVSFLFALSYKILPDVKLRWSQVWMGSVISALLFTMGKFLLGLYLSTFHTEMVFGPAGALIIILIWIYYCAQILFIGAEIIKVQTLIKHNRIRPARSGVIIKKSIKTK